jgi:hypothetical protein
MRKCFATVFGFDEDDFQEIRINYEYTLDRGSWVNKTNDKVKVNFIEILNEDMYVEPAYLDEDLRVAIASDLGVNPWLVTIECEVKMSLVYKNQKVA